MITLRYKYSKFIFDINYIGINYFSYDADDILSVKLNREDRNFN